MYFTLSLATSFFSVQNNNLTQKNYSIIKDHSLQIVYAEHTENDNDDDDNNNGKDDEYDLDEISKDYDDDDDDDFEICKYYDDNNNNGKDDDDDDADDENFKINFPYDASLDFNNPHYFSEEELPSSTLSLEDYYHYLEEYYHYLESTNPSIPTVIDRGEEEEEEENSSPEVEDSSDKNLDRYSALTDSSDTNLDRRYSDLVDLSNPSPFSRFQDPIPEHPEQPLHPDLPSIPSLPPEPAEPRNPPIPPP